MFTFNRPIVCPFILMILIFSHAFAQEDMPAPGITEKPKYRNTREIVVTATKTAIDPKETGASITIITEKEIEQRGKSFVVDLLREVPGLSVVKNGSFGGQANVFIRGAKSENVLVLVDGIRINDTMGTGKHFDFGTLQAFNIERIEIIRGAQSTLYGSDATGGVINIITKRGKDKTSIQVTAEAGSYHTFRETVSVSGATDDSHFSLGISRTDSDGITKSEKAPGSAVRPDKDAFENTSFSTKFGLKLPHDAWIDMSVLYSDSSFELDDSGFDDDPLYWGYTRNLSSQGVFRQNISSWWDHLMSLGYSSTLRKYRDKTDIIEPTMFDDSWYEGIFRRAEWQHNFRILEINTITTGMEFIDESGSSLAYSDFSGTGTTTTQFDEIHSYTMGYYIQDHLKMMDRIFLTGGVRYNKHEEFGTKISKQVSLSIITPLTETQLKGTYATGFKSPSIYQLYAPASSWGPVGNKDLKPEENTSIDFGFEQPLFDKMMVIGATWFINRYRRMIDFEYGTGYMNINRVNTNGAEISIQLKLPEDLSIISMYTYTDSEDKDTGDRLLRRPMHQGSMNINWEFLERANINIGVIYVGERNDIWFDAMYAEHNVKMDDYYKIDLNASYWITSFLQVFGRVENLTDEDYQAVVGYRTPGRSYYGGAKGVF